MRNNKRLWILTGICLLSAIILVCGIARLKAKHLIQPEGEKMACLEAEDLLYCLDDIGDASYFDKTTQEYLSFLQLKSALNKLASANDNSKNYCEGLILEYENKYEDSFEVLKEDFLHIYLGLANQMNKNITEKALDLFSKQNEIAVYNAEQSAYIPLNDQNFLEKSGECYEACSQNVLDRLKSDKATVTVNAIVQDNHIIYVVEQLKASRFILPATYLAACEKTATLYFGEYRLAIPVSGIQAQNENIADISFSEGEIDEIQCYQDKVSGKLLSANLEQIELLDENETVLKYKVADELKVYSLYGELPNASFEDLKIGYNFADFVKNESGEIIAALIVSEGELENIRVLIKASDYSSLYHDEISLYGDCDLKIISENESQLFEAGKELVVRSDSDLFVGDRILISPTVNTSRVTFPRIHRSIGSTGYRGCFEILKTQDGLVLINELPLEEYLYSVVPSEMPASYPREALCAQAISARTYAYEHMLHSGYAGFGAHVDDSTSYQVYHNIEESAPCVAAVKATSKQLLYKDGKILTTYFYSTSCGYGSDLTAWCQEEKGDFVAKHIAKMEEQNADAMTIEEAFEAFITSKNSNDYESEEGFYRWSYETTVDYDRLLQNLKDKYEANPEQILTLSKDGTYESREITDLGILRDIVIQKRAKGGAVNELLVVGSKNTIKVLLERNVRYVLANVCDHVNRQSGDTSTVSTLIPSAFIIIEVDKQKDEVVSYKIIGGGYGHGIGMSQNGAKCMAKSGMSGQEILSFFYEDSEIVSYNQIK